MRRLAVLGAAWFCAAARAQSVPLFPAVLPMPPAARTVAVATDGSSRLSVPVTIGGRPWHFLVDTASTRSVIASDVADSLDLATGKALQVLNIAGIDTVPSVIIPELGFSDFAVRNIAAPSLTRGNLGSDGLLGLDILRNKRIVLDFRRATALTIVPSSRGPQHDAGHADPDTIVVTARPRMGELIVTDAEIDGIPVSVIIDTGAEDSIGNPALADRLFRSGYRGSARPLGPATLISVTGRTLPADYALVGRWQMGGVVIADVPMAFSDVAIFRQWRAGRNPIHLRAGQGSPAIARRVAPDDRRNRHRHHARRPARPSAPPVPVRN